MSNCLKFDIYFVYDHKLGWNRIPVTHKSFSTFIGGSPSPSIHKELGKVSHDTLPQLPLQKIKEKTKKQNTEKENLA